MTRKSAGLLMAILLAMVLAAPTSSSAAAAPPVDGLVAYWPGDGNTDDLSGNGHNGTLMDGATFAAGKVGQGFNLDGYDDNVMVPDAPELDGMSQLTAAAWVKFNALPYWKWQFILSKGEGMGRGTNAYLIFLTGDTRRIGGAVESHADIRQIEAPDTIVAGSFYHVAITSDGATFKLYVNGVVRASTPFTGAVRSTWYPLYIGKRPTYRYPSIDGRGDVLNGVVDEVVVYNRALSESEIQALASVHPPDTTPPVIAPTVSGNQGDDGWYTSDVAVSWSVTDAESEITATSGCNTSAVITDTTGTTFTCTATSAGGIASRSVSVKRDATPPVLTRAAVQGTAGSAGWYRSDVLVSFTAVDSTSGLRNGADAAFSLTASGEGSAVSTGTREVYDRAGNRSMTGPFSFSIDKTAPTITGSRTPPANAAGWNNEPVGVHFDCSDRLSGLASCAPDAVLGFEGANQRVSGTATDRAGNVATTTVDGINIDKTPPRVVIQGIQDGAVYTLGNVPTPSFAATDNLSTIARSSATLQRPTTQSGAGYYSYTATATDKAGNRTTVSATYQVVYAFSGLSLTSGGQDQNFKTGSALPLKFQLKDAKGNVVANAAATLWVDGQPATSQGNANTGNSFRYDPTDQQYIYNLNTRGLAPGSHTLAVSLEDGTTHRIQVTAR